MNAAVERIELTPYRLPLHAAWRFGTEALHERRGFLLCATDRDGRRGWGEAAPLEALGTESPQACRDWLEAQLPARTGAAPDSVLAELPPPAVCPPAARCGLETALLDLAARQAGKPLARRLARRAEDTMAVNASLGAVCDLDVHAVLQALANGFSCLKVKVGVDDPQREAAVLLDLIAAVADGVEWRLDANRAWDRDTALRFLSALPPGAVRWIEEPLNGSLEEIAALMRQVPISLALDESLHPGNPDQVLAASAATALILKPMRLGGLLPCLELARRAVAQGVVCVVTTSLDGAVGTLAAAHLAAAVNTLGAPAAHGLATSGWFTRDLAPAPDIRGGRLHLPPGPGLGCHPELSPHES
jgi:o-succinylbenzoate synthase